MCPGHRPSGKKCIHRKQRAVIRAAPGQLRAPTCGSRAALGRLLGGSQAAPGPFGRLRPQMGPNGAGSALAPGRQGSQNRPPAGPAKNVYIESSGRSPGGSRRPRATLGGSWAALGRFPGGSRAAPGWLRARRVPGLPWRSSATTIFCPPAKQNIFLTVSITGLMAYPHISILLFFPRVLLS